MKFYDRNGETNRQPGKKLLAKLAAEGEKFLAKAHLHEPGDGWHYVPSGIEICHNGKYWYPCVETSEGAILAHVEDVCKLMGIDHEELYRTAYPDEQFDPVTDEDRAACARPATFDDVRAVIDDLGNVNCHTLASVFQEATEREFCQKTRIAQSDRREEYPVSNPALQPTKNL